MHCMCQQLQENGVGSCFNAPDIQVTMLPGDCNNNIVFYLRNLSNSSMKRAVPVEVCDCVPLQ